VGRTKIEPCDDCRHKGICKYHGAVASAIGLVKSLHGLEVEFVRVKCKHYEEVGGRG